jgi:ketosteroid isomerase-like protein
MKRRVTIPLLFACAALVLTACNNSNDSSSSQDPTALATELIDQYAKAVFTKDQEALGELLSDAYLLRRSDGTGYDRDGYVKALAQDSDYELVDYSISDITAQQDGDILVAMFTLQGDIEESGRSVISEPSPSLVTFVRVDGEWKLASDAFFSR